MDVALISDTVNHLVIKEISLLRGDKPILSNFSLSLSASQWIVLRGRNGSGKSTLLKAIVGLVPLHQGSIDCPDFCYLGHQNGFRESMTVSDQLAFVANHFKVPLQATPVDHLLDLPLHHLSAGLKRQVALCQFIFSPHSLWIMDEPFEHLDKQAQTYFLTLMQGHIDRGGSILQTSHETISNPKDQEIWLS
ncbi:ATP-binding cassette domain-containing protein [Candidatus Paracaedibacter acanthamoebae]|uniref:ABC transporter ATP-binding protein n=1 Tax=Candidatus Odyssella acanthamoebae TaxID=91604 RepID=UPI000A06BC12